MKKILLVRFTIILFMISLVAACSSKKEYTTPESVVKANIQYLNEKDIDNVMSTIHPQNPDFELVKENITKLLNRYDLNYKLLDTKILEQNDNEVKIRFTQEVKKIKGPDFKDNITTGVHTLRKDGDSWRIYSTDMMKVESLDQDEAKNSSN